MSMSWLFYLIVLDLRCFLSLVRRRDYSISVRRLSREKVARCSLCSSYYRNLLVRHYSYATARRSFRLCSSGLTVGELFKDSTYERYCCLLLSASENFRVSSSRSRNRKSLSERSLIRIFLSTRSLRSSFFRIVNPSYVDCFSYRSDCLLLG
jgi:hypothetical protein